MFYHWNVIGHEDPLGALEKDFLNGIVRHAYLFVGPEQIGKFAAAKASASILQCPDNFCHRCPTCIQIEKRCHPDTIELADDGESIKINTIRDIITRLSMTRQNKYKILLIQNIGRLTEEAANCLLKILEEPPEQTVFFFTARHVREILPTIVSRMQVIRFKKLPEPLLKIALKKKFPEANDELLDQVIGLSLGRSERAVELLARPELCSEFLQFYQTIEFLVEHASLSSRISTLQQLLVDENKIKLLLPLLTYYLRKKMLLTASLEERNRLLNALLKIHEVYNLLSRNVNPRLLYENIMIHL